MFSDIFNFVKVFVLALEPFSVQKCLVEKVKYLEIIGNNIIESFKFQVLSFISC